MPSISSFREEDIVDSVKKRLPVETSTKATGFIVGCISFFTDKSLVRSTLTCFEARIGFANHVHSSTTANNMTIRMQGFGGSERLYNFHKGFKKSARSSPVNEFFKEFPERL